MMNQDILKKAIYKAELNNFDFLKWYYDNIIISERRDIGFREAFYFVLAHEYACTALIFSHDFARAFWGEKPMYVLSGGEPIWQHYLQEMVLEEKHLKYLEKFL